MEVNGEFRVTFTADFLTDIGRPRFREYGFEELDRFPGIHASHFPKHEAEIAPEQIAGSQGVIVLTPRVTAATLEDSSALLSISRFGVGYDSVDVDACTKADVLVTITSGAVDRPVAEAVVGWMIALSHHVLSKDRLLREGGWDDRTRYMGTELRDRTLGVVGFGGIGRHLIGLLSGFGMATPLIYDPYIDEETARSFGVGKVDLDTLLEVSDFVSLNCPLNQQTRNLISVRELDRMKPTAWLINTARGGIVDEDALYLALQEEKIAGAAIDCFEVEPITVPHRFGEFENVLLAPHSIAWTHELFRDMGRSAAQTMIQLSQGERPKGVINPEVLDRQSFQSKWMQRIGK